MLSASQRCHWNEYDVGLPVQVPSSAVSVSPTAGVPYISGGWGFRATAPPPPAATGSVCAD